MVEPWGFMSCYETTVLVLEIEHGRPGLGANIFCTCAGGGRGFLKLKTYLPWKLLGIVDFTKSLWVLLHRSHFPSCSQVILHQPHWTLIISEFCVIVRTASYGQVVYDSILDRSAKTAGFKFDPTKQQPGVPSAWQLKSWVMMCSFVQNWNIECVEMCVKNWGQQKHTCCILQFHTSMQHVFWEGDLGCLHFFDKTTFLVNRDHPFRGSCIIFIRMCGAECFP